METRLMLTKDEHAMLDHLFTYHPPSGNQIEHYRVLRSRARWFAETVLATTPPCPVRDQALMLLQQSLMMANAAIATEGHGFHEFNQTQSARTSPQETGSARRQEDSDGDASKGEA